MAAAAIIDRTFIDVCAKSKRKIISYKINEKTTATSNPLIAS